MKQSELLRKQADMMDMAEKYGVDDWRKMVKVKWAGGVYKTIEVEKLYAEYTYRFALGVVEGKPVFEGDTLWHCNREFTADEHLPDYILDMKNPQELSWNPPKPKTVTVELLREDAEELSLNTPMSAIHRRVTQACCKALEEQK